VRNRFTVVALAAVALTLGACRDDGPPDDQRTDTVTPQSMEQARAAWPAGLSEVVDSANAAYSEGDYDNALRLYRRGTEIAPDVTATWFGIYMAEHARGNIAAADSAMARAQSLAPGASLIHVAPGDTAAGDSLPPNHP
jgi:tetratricopeptide (TPR) repeat protein